ncbi:MAG: 3-ketoacyl-ACP reductase FabG2, partial [Acinetobacter sp.]
MARRILVTGSSRGIGREIALQLAQAGFDVTVHARSRMDEAADVVQQIQQLGRNSHALQFDVNAREGVQQILQQDIEQHGAFYGVVVNAGLTRDAAFPALSDDDWDIVLSTALDGFYNVLKPLIMPMIHLKQGGRIVTISSVSGMMGNRGQVNYSAAKSGLIGATKALSLELAKRKITVNCVAPGLIETEMVTEEVQQHALKMIPMQRMGKVQEVASVV